MATPPSPPPPPPSPQRNAPHVRSRILLAVGVVGSLLLGFGIGVMVPDDTTVEDALRSDLADAEQSMETLQAQRDELNGVIAEWEARQDELDEQEASLVQRAAGLDEQEVALKERDAAVAQVEETIAAHTVTDGIWTVGVDIQPGTYRAVDVSADCYWAILVSGSNGEDIVANDIPGGGNPTVTVSEGQDFETRRCGDWVRQ